MILHLTCLHIVRGHIVDVTFNDGTQKRINMKPLMRGNVFAAMRDPAEFAKVQLDDVLGVPYWPNGADLAPEALYHAPDLKSEDLESRRPPAPLTATPQAAA